MDKNVGRIDQVLRIILGVILIWVGLWPLNGLDQSLLGVTVSLLAIIPFWMAITRNCPVFRFFNFSSIPKHNKHE